MSLGQDDNNRSMLGYSNSTNRLYIGTKQGGTNYFDTVSVTSGKVGIGTVSPGSKLQVTGDISFGTRLDSATRYIGKGTTSGGGFASNSNWIGFASSSADDWITFGVHKSGVGGGEVMRLAPDGNLGIGCVGPTEKLDVNGNIAMSGNATTRTIWNKGYGGAVQLLRSDANATRWAKIGIVDSNGSFVHGVTIINDGNVGIGTTSPSATLHVRDTSTSTSRWTAAFVADNASAVSAQSHDHVLIQSNDVPSLKFYEYGQDQVGGIAVGDNNTTLSTTEAMRFYVNGSATGPLHDGLNGTCALKLQTNGTSDFYGSVTLANDKILAIGTGAGNSGSIRIFDNSSTSRFMEWEPVGTSDAYFRFNGGTSYASPYRTYFNQQGSIVEVTTSMLTEISPPCRYW